MKYKLFCDMDGVICDFLGHFKTTTGIDVKEVEDGFWTYIQGNKAFWSRMPWLSDGKELWDYIKKFKPTMLTTPTRDTASYAGKREWVHRELGKKVPIILDSQKFKYAKPGYILLDDMLKNVTPWENHGGIGVLHTDAKSSILTLKGYLGS